jgi:hypothetical protein
MIQILIYLQRIVRAQAAFMESVSSPTRADVIVDGKEPTAVHVLRDTAELNVISVCKEWSFQREGNLS